MFDNIGGKIKVLAVTFTIIGMVMSIIYGLIIISETDSAAGLIVMLVGCLFSWIGSFTLYGLGHLIENTDILVEQGRHDRPLYTRNTTGYLHRCPECGNMISEEPCEYCSSVQKLKAAENGRIFTEQMVSCPTCGAVQKSGRSFCYKCGQEFLNTNQGNAPYWCGSCGQAGPFNGECPNCGSSIKIFKR